jgi:hypothetical protein
MREVICGDLLDLKGVVGSPVVKVMAQTGGQQGEDLQLFKEGPQLSRLKARKQMKLHQKVETRYIAQCFEMF